MYIRFIEWHHFLMFGLFFCKSSRQHEAISWLYTRRNQGRLPIMWYHLWMLVYSPLFWCDCGMHSRIICHTVGIYLYFSSHNVDALETRFQFEDRDNHVQKRFDIRISEDQLRSRCSWVDRIRCGAVVLFCRWWGEELYWKCMKCWCANMQPNNLRENQREICRRPRGYDYSECRNFEATLQWKSSLRSFSIEHDTNRSYCAHANSSELA